MVRRTARHRKVVLNPVSGTGSKPSSKVCAKCLCAPCECKTMRDVPGKKTKKSEKKARREARYKQASQALNNKGGRS